MRRWKHWLWTLRHSPPHAGIGLWRSVVLSVMVGIGAGCGAALLVQFLQVCTWFFLGQLAGYAPQGPAFQPQLLDLAPIAAVEVRRWVILVLPAAGALVSGALVWRFAPEAAGHGTDAAIEAYHLRGGRVRARVPPIKAIASSLLVGTGGSAGFEGPIAQIGSGIGSTLARLLRLPTPQRRILMAAGLAGGVGALFHAPMAGALFAAEVMYRDLDLEYEVLVPAVISSISAHAVFSLVFGFHPLFHTPALAFREPRELLLYLVLALVVALGGRFYTWAFYTAHDLFHRLRIHPALKPAVGGLLTGLVGFFFLPAIASGYGTVQRALVHGTGDAGTYGPVTLGVLAGVFVLKTLTTACSVGSGGSGGVFGPAIVVGGALGGATGLVFQGLLPDWSLSVGTFTILGMLAFFGSIANTPISTIIMVSEMTGNYNLLVPSMWVCILAFVLNRKVRLYRSQLPNRFEAPVHRGAMISGLLRNLRVADLAGAKARDFVAVRTGDPLVDLARRLADSAQAVFPVVDDAGALVGVVSHNDLRPLSAADPALWRTLVVDDAMSPDAPTVARDDALSDVLRVMESRRDGAVVVRSDDVPPRPLAVVSHDDIMGAYRAEIAARR